MSDYIEALTRPLNRNVSIDRILERLTNLAACFAERPDTRIHLPFLQAYRESSRCLLELTAQDRDDIAPLPRLAVNFGNRYLWAMRYAMLTEEPRMPWQTYFDYTQHSRRNPLLALILGVRSHISGDLPSSLRATGIKEYRAYCAFDASLRALSPEAVGAAQAYAGPTNLTLINAPPGLIRSTYDFSVRRWRAGMGGP